MQNHLRCYILMNRSAQTNKFHFRKKQSNRSGRTFFRRIFTSLCAYQRLLTLLEMRLEGGVWWSSCLLFNCVFLKAARKVNKPMMGKKMTIVAIGLFYGVSDFQQFFFYFLVVNQSASCYISCSYSTSAFFCDFFFMIHIFVIVKRSNCTTIVIIQPW